MDTTREQIIDVDQYWNQVDISVSSALVLGKRVNTLDKRTVERIGGLAPWQAPRDRAATGEHMGLLVGSCLTY